ncbi:hypothetical protein BGZ57DRAFT_924510 [Hyaloscypha finlandica]|nr:hypothetical protein BGZ57DRAFT_924510 [Hyaloscypha finlandica]
MRSPSTFVILLVTLLTSATAAPQLVPVIGGLLGGIPVVGAITGYLGNVLNLLGVLYAAPPPFLLTKNPSPECKNVNNGALLCCSSTINGDMPLVVELAQLAGQFKLNPNSINGLYCKKDFTTCNPGTKLCCQVDSVVKPPVINDVLSLALWCQNAPTQDTCSA